MDEIKYIEPIQGAATYQAEKMASNKWVVIMYPCDEPNLGAVIQSGLISYEAARKAANRWQKKENKSLLKYQKLNL